MGVGLAGASGFGGRGLPWCWAAAGAQQAQPAHHQGAVGWEMKVRSAARAGGHLSRWTWVARGGSTNGAPVAASTWSWQEEARAAEGCPSRPEGHVGAEAQAGPRAGEKPVTWVTGQAWEEGRPGDTRWLEGTARLEMASPGLPAVPQQLLRAWPSHPAPGQPSATKAGDTCKPPPLCPAPLSYKMGPRVRTAGDHWGWT